MLTFVSEQVVCAQTVIEYGTTKFCVKSDIAKSVKMIALTPPFYK